MGTGICDKRNREAFSAKRFRSSERGRDKARISSRSTCLFESREISHRLGEGGPRRCLLSLVRHETGTELSKGPRMF